MQPGAQAGETCTRRRNLPRDPQGQGHRRPPAGPGHVASHLAGCDQARHGGGRLLVLSLVSCPRRSARRTLGWPPCMGEGPAVRSGGRRPPTPGLCWRPTRRATRAPKGKSVHPYGPFPRSSWHYLCREPWSRMGHEILSMATQLGQPRATSTTRSGGEACCLEGDGPTDGVACLAMEANGGACTCT